MFNEHSVRSSPLCVLFFYSKAFVVQLGADIQMYVLAVQDMNFPLLDRCASFCMSKSVFLSFTFSKAFCLALPSILSYMDCLQSIGTEFGQMSLDVRSVLMTEAFKSI